MFNTKTLILAVLVLLFINSFTPIGSNIISSFSKVDCSSPEYVLANECQEETIENNDFIIKKFKYILCEMEGKCSESRENIANTILWGYEIATKDYKKDLSLLSFAEGLNGYITYGNQTDLDLKVREYLSFLHN